ncbi:phosphatase PAP2 family protein [Flexivirga alba]|uniref:Phosphatase PAP2 family protein n=1 Tax=Flexivirga alba TaxID=702742 RepID=A0ABW2ADC1_9MICO
MLQHDPQVSESTDRPVPHARPVPHPQALVVTVVLWALGIGIGIAAMSIGARGTGEFQLDRTIAADRGTLVSDVSRVINVVLGPAVGPVLMVLLCIVLWRTVGRIVALRAGALTLGGWLSIEVFKMLFHRHRPPTSGVHALVVETQADSFPSGHTAFTAALVAGFFLAVAGHRKLQRIILLVGLPLVVIVAGSRLVLGAHYLADVVAAPLLAWGTIAIAVACGLADRGSPTFLPQWWHQLVTRRAGQ